jgi:hypothetical protein
VSNAPFDQGHERHWHSAGTHTLGQAVNSPQGTVMFLDCSVHPLYRVDHAVVTMDYRISDVNASASLLFANISFGFEVPILSVAANPQTYLVGAVPTVSGINQEFYTAQLANPFYVSASAAIYLLGSGSSGSASGISAMVAASYSDYD